LAFRAATQVRSRARADRCRPFCQPIQLCILTLRQQSAANICALAVVKKTVSANFWTSLISVLVGNAIYSVATPVLPPLARHNFNTLDLGLLVDFWICLFVLGLLKLWLQRRRRARPPRDGTLM